MPRVIDIQRRHMELGRIRLGEKGDKGQPQRLDTWRLTSASKSLLDSAATVYGGTVEEWSDAPDKGYYQLTTDTTELDVMVPPGDAYSQYYELWSGGGCKRRCDGVTELLTGSPCKCDADERDCKITTRINVMLPQIAGLGVWRLESHGYYAAAELPDMLELLQQVSGGRLVSGVLRIEQRSSKRDGKTNRFPVPVLDLPNITLASLTGNQVVVNAPMALEAGRPALADGSTALPGDASFDNGTPGFGEPPPLPATAGELRESIAAYASEHGIGIDAIERAADAVGVAKGAKATDDQLRAILAHLESPGRGVPTAAPALDQPSATDGDGAAPVARGGESSESPPPTAGSEGAVSPSLPSGPALDPQALLESAQTIVGGEIIDVVPPELQARIERARAKGKAKEEPETLAEQLRVEA
jgi:hypothetical protein